jgi:hypothetical protein
MGLTPLNTQFLESKLYKVLFIAQEALSQLFSGTKQ